MPANPYKARNLVAVKVTSNLNFMYGFHTNAESDDQTTLGHVPAQVNGSYINGLVLGANQPKPARLSKYRTGGGYKSSFCDINNIDTARAANWKLVSLPTIAVGANGLNSKCVYVKISTADVDGNVSSEIKYAWMMPDFLYSRIVAGDLSALGIRDGVGVDDLVFGARHPKPRRAVFTAIDNEGYVGTRSTFIDDSAISSLPSGWRLPRSRHV